MNVDSLICFVLSCSDFGNQIVWCNAIDIFENLIKDRGALIWVENFCSYDAKDIDYWTILLVNINKIMNKKLLKSKSVLGVVGK
jgi:hypothetical protein